MAPTSRAGICVWRLLTGSGPITPGRVGGTVVEEGGEDDMGE